MILGLIPKSVSTFTAGERGAPANSDLNLRDGTVTSHDKSDTFRRAARWPSRTAPRSLVADPRKIAPGFFDRQVLSVGRGVRVPPHVFLILFLSILVVVSVTVTSYRIGTHARQRFVRASATHSSVPNQKWRERSHCRIFTPHHLPPSPFRCAVAPLARS